MSAIWMRARAELRSRWAASLALALIIGVAAGVVMTAAAGARRTDSAYPRLTEWSGGPDAGLGLGGFGQTGIRAEDVRRLPEVTSSVVSDAFLFVPETLSGDYLFIGQGAGGAVDTERELRALGRVKILEGRMFDPDRPDEVIVGQGTATIGYGTSSSRQVHAGDSVSFRFLKRGGDVDAFQLAGDISEIPEEILTPPFEATVVGIYFAPGDFGDNAYGDVTFTPAFDREHRDELANLRAMSVTLRHGQADAPLFLRDLQRLSGGGNVGAGSEADTTGAFQRLVHPQAIALWVFAGLAALAGILICGQALARQVFMESVEVPILRALGMRRGQLFAVATVRAAVLGAAAAVLAVATATVGSIFMPIGLARMAEPEPGVSFDALVLGPGIVATLLLVVAIAAIPAWRASRAGGVALGTTEIFEGPRPSAVVGAVARAGLSPPASAGTRMALEPGRGRTAVPVRTTIVGVTLAIASVMAAVTFATSFQRLFDTPRLYGWSWDVAVGNPYSGDLGGRFLPKLENDRFLGGIAAGNVLARLEVSSAGKRLTVIPTFGLDQIRGSVHPPVTEGRWPDSPHEIALGAKTLANLGVSIGDTVELRSGDTVVRDVRVVGRAVFLDTAGLGGLGEGAGMTFDGLHRLRATLPQNVFPLELASGVDRRAALDKLQRQFGFVFTPGDLDINGLRELRPVKGFPLVLAAVLAFAAVGTIGHTLAVSIRRRRRDLAILKTLGFVRRQVSATVAWQASILAAAALLLGLPLGVAAGRWAWTVFADQLGIVPEPAVPLAAVLLLVPGTILLVNIIAALPGWAASRVHPAAALRTE